MTVDQMRKYVASAYDGIRWKALTAKMPDKQVIAIYYKFLNEGRFDKKPKSKTKYEQLSLFDFLPKTELMKV